MVCRVELLGSVASQRNTPSAPTWVSDLFVFALVVHFDNPSYANLSDFIYYFSYSSLTHFGKWFDLIYQCFDLYSFLCLPRYLSHENGLCTVSVACGSTPKSIMK